MYTHVVIYNWHVPKIPFLSTPEVLTAHPWTFAGPQKERIVFQPSILQGRALNFEVEYSIIICGFSFHLFEAYQVELFFLRDTETEVNGTWTEFTSWERCMVAVCKRKNCRKWLLLLLACLSKCLIHLTLFLLPVYWKRPKIENASLEVLKTSHFPLKQDCLL